MASASWLSASIPNDPSHCSGKGHQGASKAAATIGLLDTCNTSITAVSFIERGWPLDFISSCASRLSNEGKEVNARILYEDCLEHYDPNIHTAPEPPPKRSGRSGHRSSHWSSSSSSDCSSASSSIFFSLPYLGLPENEIRGSEFNSLPPVHRNENFISAGLPAFDMVTDSSSGSSLEFLGEDCVDGPGSSTSSTRFSYESAAASTSSQNDMREESVQPREPEKRSRHPEGNKPRQPPIRDTLGNEPAKKEKLAVVQREHEILETSRRCIECKVKPRDTTFLPCGHFTTCGECAEPLYTCRTCKQDILGTVNTFLEASLPTRC